MSYNGITDPNASLLVHPRDIKLADVIAEHYRFKNDPEYRRKNLPESALTDVERTDLARLRRQEGEAIDRASREFWERYPLGCDVDGYGYDRRWRKGTLYLPPRNKPSMRVIAFYVRWWPGVRRIVVKEGDGDCINYVATYTGDEEGQSFGKCGWWKALRPDHPDYVY